MPGRENFCPTPPAARRPAGRALRGGLRRMGRHAPGRSGCGEAAQISAAIVRHGPAGRTFGKTPAPPPERTWGERMYPAAIVRCTPPARTLDEIHTPPPVTRTFTKSTPAPRCRPARPGGPDFGQNSYPTARLPSCRTGTAPAGGFWVLCTIRTNRRRANLEETFLYSFTLVW